MNRLQRKVLRALWRAIERQYGGTWTSLTPGDVAYMESVELSAGSPMFQRNQTLVRITLVVNNDGLRR